MPGRRARTIAELCGRLRHLEGCCGTEQASSDAIVDAEQDTLAELVDAQAQTISDLITKLGIVTRRATASDGFLSDDEMHLLRSILRDAHRLNGPTNAGSPAKYS